MSLNENKVLIHQLINEVSTKGKFEVLNELLSDNYIEHAGPPTLPQGREAFKQLTLVFRNAFPDWTFTIEDVVAEGDRMAIRGTGRGTHLGTFLHFPPTGKQGTMQAMHLFRVDDGKVVERWGFPDMMGLVQQLTTG